MVKIKGSIWFSLISGTMIGIVVMNNGYEDKAYIGIGTGLDEKQDEQQLARDGTPFPLKQALELLELI